jgi:hypothetical protein
MEIRSPELILASYSAARPHGALHASLALHNLQRAVDEIGFGELAHADADGLGHWHFQAHLVLLEIDDKKLKLHAGDFLLFDRHDLANAVGRIDDRFTGLEALACRRFFLLGRHSFQKLPVSRRPFWPGPGQ